MLLSALTESVSAFLHQSAPIQTHKEPTFMTQLRKRSAFRPRVVQPPPADDTRGATPERTKHAQGFVERGNLGRGRTGIVTMRDSPIERARARNVINQAQYTAAVKYRHHWYRAGLASPLSSVELNRIFAKDMTSFSGMARTEAQVFHRQRYREAVQHIGMIGASVDDPGHAHAIHYNTAVQSGSTTPCLVGITPAGGSSGSSDIATTGITISNQDQTASGGSGTAHNNVQPTIIFNKIIFAGI